MDTILREIELALDAHLYYLAVALTLTLPDICSALESSDGETSSPQYRAWFTTNLASVYPRMTDNDCWKLRCGVLHQGRCGHPQMQYDRIIFTLPNPSRALVHNTVLGRALNLDAVTFCHEVMQAVHNWLAAKTNDPNTSRNLPNLVHFRPNGIPPYIVGLPVIA